MSRWVVMGYVTDTKQTLNLSNMAAGMVQDKNDVTLVNSFFTGMVFSVLVVTTN